MAEQLFGRRCGLVLGHRFEPNDGGASEHLVEIAPPGLARRCEHHRVTSDELSGEVADHRQRRRVGPMEVVGHQNVGCDCDERVGQEIGQLPDLLGSSDTRIELW